MTTTEPYHRDDKPRPIFGQTKHLSRNRDRRRRTVLKTTLIATIVIVFLGLAVWL